MNIQFLSLQATNIGSRLLHDYFSGSTSLYPFYSFLPIPQKIHDTINARKNKPVDRHQLVSILSDQYQGIAISERLKENIQSLVNENTFTITTGHQLSLITGPLYFVYKILSVIALTELCKKQLPTYNFVPIYWMNSEDHDFNEINHIWINNQRFEWKRPTEISMATGRMKTHDIALFFDSLPASIQSLPSFSEWKELYINSNSLAEATRKLVNHLFGKFGLVVIDQDDPRLKRLAFHVFYKELTQQASFRWVTQTSVALQNLGYHAQVKPRELNLFYHHPQVGRQRLIINGDKIQVLNSLIEFHKDEVANFTNEHLHSFSTNVVTRPMYQLSVLPDIAYVGGPAEVSYWLQYKAMFEHFGVFYPMILLRDSFLLLNSSVTRKINKLKIPIHELFADEALWHKTQLSRMATEINILPFKQSIKEIYQKLADQFALIDPTLKPAALAELQKNLNSLKNLEAKYLRAWKQKNEIYIRQLQEIRDAVFPGGELQERHNHLWAHTSNPDQFIDNLLSVSNPWNQQIKILEL